MSVNLILNDVQAETTDRKSIDVSVAKKKGSPTSRVVRPSWFKLTELAAAMKHADQHATPSEHVTGKELIQRTKSVLKNEIGFISNVEFRAQDAAKRIFESPLELGPDQAETANATVRRAGADLPMHLSRLCEARLLTPVQEATLFRRMNFLRQQAALHRSMLNVAEPSATRLLLVERLLLLADWHRDRIVESNTRLVFSIVKKFINANNQFDDLLSDGIFALMRAVEKFDYDRGFRFSTYATQVVRRNAYREIVQSQDERTKMVGGLQDMDIDLSDEERSPAISESRWHELRSRLSLMLGDLDRREKFIIRARFSLGSHRRVHTLQALADRLGVSKERVRQLERRAMDKLRAMAGEVKLVELEA